ncbi:hypothetical protein F8M41_015699 [Gigaspora margarita]|uniref:Uncharacterized protein n=1 Tax=Gigaspora margarita TaxID=4874 RepID=A0A8H3WUD9_GIGMA|nr:hypothetical protein F8M41_015699 [Gigaspora margarita]
MPSELELLRRRVAKLEPKQIIKQNRTTNNASSVPADSPCNKIFDIEAEEEPCDDLEKWTQPKSYDTKTVTNLSRSDNVSSEISELERDNENDEVDASQIVE